MRDYFDISDEFVVNAEAVVCGDAYDVRVVSAPDENDMCLVDVPFEEGAYYERLAIVKDNIWPTNEQAIILLMGGN